MIAKSMLPLLSHLEALLELDGDSIQKLGVLEEETLGNLQDAPIEARLQKQKRQILERVEPREDMVGEERAG